MDLFDDSKIKLRWYQTQSVEEALQKTSLGFNPVIVLPTGAGKSIVIAEICRRKSIFKKSVLVLAGRKELVKQNAEKIKSMVNAGVGIYSAGLGQKDIQDITVANIQSIYTQRDSISFDLILIDEAHEINHNDEGRYRTFLKTLKEKNKKIEVIGLTATPYRLGHGLITDKPAIFDCIIQSAKVKELQDQGFLCKITTKSTNVKINTEGVHTRGGEFIESELQKKIEGFDDSQAVDEIIFRGDGRKSWLIFATGVDHAKKINSILKSKGIKSEVVYGDMNDADRDSILSDFKNGKLQCVVNANILTTGFDNPMIDLIAFLRPTMSRGLFNQMMGRGFRVSDGKENCLILDFSGNIPRHGLDFDSISIKSSEDKNGNGKGTPIVKICPQCGEFVAIQTRRCPYCGYEKPNYWTLWDGTEYSEEPKTFTVDVLFWGWEDTISKKSGKRMLVCTYTTMGENIKEYFLLWHGGFATMKSMGQLNKLGKSAGININDIKNTEDFKYIPKPAKIKYHIENGYPRVDEYIYDAIPF